MIQKSKQKPDPLDLIKKYILLLWQKKIWIITISIIVAIVWGVVFKFVLQKQREFSATSVIKFEDPRRRTQMGAVTEFSLIGAEGNVAILYANSFLTTVVDSLQLNLFLRDPIINRFEFFKDIEIGENVKYGSYIITLDEKIVTITYSNIREKINNEFIESFDLPVSDTILIYIGDLKFSFLKRHLIENKTIEFGLNQTRIVVDYLKGKIRTTMDRRTNTLLNVELTAGDPKQAAELLNIITDLYINKLLEVKRFRTTSVLNSLEEQLTASKSELEVSENNLKIFREKNPYLFLSNSGSELVSNLTSAQNDLNSNDYQYVRIDNILSALNVASEDDRVNHVLNIISLLEEMGVAGTQILSTQYTARIAERNDLLEGGYSTQSSQVQESDIRVKGIENQIINKLTEEQRQIENQKSNLQSTIRKNRRTITRLPQGELKLAEFQRDRDVKSQIYSNILIRYNEAKVLDAAVISDALIIDRAEVPIDYGGGNSMMYLVGPLLGLFLSIAYFVGMDFLDNTIRDVEELESRLNIPVLATIPLILGGKEIPDELNAERNLDPKLIASSYAPSIAGEKFRLLRTKIILEMQQKRSIVMTSHSPNEGKSLVTANLAITFAQQKVPTILLDCDLRRGVLHNSFSCNKKPGISDILIKNVPVTHDEISKSIQNTHIPNLFLISSGMQVPNPSELLGGLRMKQFIQELEKKFGAVIIDTPPIEFIPDALILNSIVHNFLMVVRYGKTKMNTLAKKIDEYSMIRDDLKGIIINGVTQESNNEYHSYSYYHY